MVAKSFRLAAFPILAGLLLGGGVVAYRMQHSTATATPTGDPRKNASGALVVSTDRLNFGPLDSDRAAVRQILLRNTGSTPLHVTVGDPGTGLAVDARRLTLDPGALGRVMVTAAPSSRLIRGELRIATEEDPSHPYLVALEGGSSAAGTTETAAARSLNGVACQAGNCSGADGDVAMAPGSVVLTRPGSVAAADSSSSANPRKDSGAPPSLAFTRTSGESPRASENSDGTTVVPSTIADATPRSMADRVPVTPPDRARDGETPQPIRRPHRDDEGTATDDEETDPTNPGVSLLAVSPSSTVTLMGTTNQFYPQQLGVMGTSAGGSFSLSSVLQVPRIPLAFGQSMEFSQHGSAVGSFDAASGQVNLSLPLQAVDSTGKAAPVVLSLTTGTVVIRNPSGVLVSATGTPRSATGSLRLVGIGKIPTGYRNGAEEQLVTVEILGTLSLSNPAEAQSAPTGTGREL